MYSRSYTILFALLAFATFAFAKPVRVAENGLSVVGQDLVGLKACLAIFVELKTHCLDIIAKIHAAVNVDVNADVSVYIYEIIACIKVAITAIINVGVILNLKDLVTINACAQVCADIIIAIHACLAVVAHIGANVKACVALDLCLKVLLTTCQVYIVGLVQIVAKLCVSVNVHLELALTACLTLLGLY